MKTQKRHYMAGLLPLATLTLILALLVSAAPPASMEPLQRIPEGALFVASAGNPGRLMMNALAFARKTGIQELETPLAKVLEALEGRGGLPADIVDLAGRIDWSRRLVLAVYPPGTGSRPGVLAHIPAHNPGALQTAILQASERAGDPASTSLILPGYVTVALGLEAPRDTEFKKLDLARLSAYPSSSIATWINIEAGRDYASLVAQGLSSVFGSTGPRNDDTLGGEGLDPDWEDDSWEDEWDGDWDWDAQDWDVEDPEPEEPTTEDREAEYWSGSPTEGNSGGLRGLEALNGLGSFFDEATGPLAELKSMFKDIRAADFGLVMEADRVWIRGGLTAVPGSEVHRMSSEAASGQLPIPYLQYLESDALISMAWSAKPGWALNVLESLYQALLSDETLARMTLSSLKASMAATGTNGAMHLDVSISDELASALRLGSLSGEEALPILRRGLSFDAAGVLQLIDRQAFRDAQGESMALLESPAYRSFLLESKLEIQAKRRIGSMDGLPFDSYEYGILSADRGGMAEGVVEIFRAMAGPLLSPVYVYRGDKAYIGFGKPESLRTLIGRDRAARPLQAAPRFRALRGGAPADARGLAYLSTGTLMRRIMQVLPEEKRILPFGYGDLYGILGWFSASPGQVGLGLGLGAEDIKAFRALLN